MQWVKAPNRDDQPIQIFDYAICGRLEAYSANNKWA
jgi:hypothetical protein